MKFEKYPFAPEVKRSLETLGFVKPTDIQYKSIGHIMGGEDVLAIAQTGTGKTAAFAIPIINALHRQKSSKRSEGIKCVIMVPTRELALQITGVIQTIARYTKVEAFCVFGGVEQDPQITKLQKGIDILVATPGRLFDLCAQGYIDLRKVETLVLDEADHMLALGFIKDIQHLIHYLPKGRQTLFFSATIDEEIKRLAYSLVDKPVRIQISPKDPVSKNVDHAVAFIEMDDKRFFLERVINDHSESKILVFVRTKVRAERVANAMRKFSIECDTLHGDKAQTNRLDVLQRFRTGDIQVLIATDVSARGIDIPNVEYVINYDLPDLAENYVHRVGRTGRGTNKGNAIAFCSEDEKPILEEIEQYITKEVKRLTISKNDYDSTVELSGSDDNDWKSLMKGAEEEKAVWTKKKKKKRKR